MLISSTCRCIFVHVFKTGGTSVKAALDPYADEPERYLSRRPPRRSDRSDLVYRMWMAVWKHASAARIRSEIDREVFDDFYKFAFVRNPWELQVAMYHFILQATDHPRHSTVRDLGSFAAYVRWLLAEARPYSSGAPKLQVDALTDDHGELIVDFVGRYERFRDDFSTVCRRIGIAADLPHLNRSRHRSFREYYDDTTAHLVHDHFRKDIEAFGYTFDAG